MKKLVTSMGVASAGIICLFALDSKVDNKAKKGYTAPAAAPLASDSKENGKLKKEDVVSAVLPTAEAAFPNKIAVISIAKFGAEYYKAKEANENCAKAIEGVQKELLSMGADYEKNVKDYKDLKEKSENPALTEEAKKKAKVEAESLEEALKIKESAIRDFKVGSENRIVKMVSDAKTEIMQLVKQKIREIAEKKNVNFVFDSEAPGMLLVMGALDITEDVLVALNADRPPQVLELKTEATATAAPAATGEKAAATPAKK
ncbi:MAG: OmpH family outer membrane protein [Puniceicoccales bacterium]|jgi:Skp family chaperone for outer membrane proteins|nr:OmpH family outer membrane protein [Puniceicoccales bacterium]